MRVSLCAACCCELSEALCRASSAQPARMPPAPRQSVATHATATALRPNDVDIFNSRPLLFLRTEGAQSHQFANKNKLYCELYIFKNIIEVEQCKDKLRLRRFGTRTACRSLIGCTWGIQCHLI